MALLVKREDLKKIHYEEKKIKGGYLFLILYISVNRITNNLNRNKKIANNKSRSSCSLPSART